MSKTTQREMLRKLRLEKRKHARAVHREAARAALDRARRVVKETADRRRETMAKAVAVCRKRRVALAESRKARRAELLAKLREQFEREKEAARCACEARKARVRRGGGTAKEKAARLLREEKQLQRILHPEYWEKQSTAPKGRVQSAIRRAEVSSQSSDEVESNIPPELVPIWRKVRSRIRGSERRSRTEAFLEWVAENEGEVYAMHAARADAETRKAVRELRKAEREARRRRVPLDEAVPF